MTEKHRESTDSMQNVFLNMPLPLWKEQSCMLAHNNSAVYL